MPASSEEFHYLGLDAHADSIGEPSHSFLRPASLADALNAMTRGKKLSEVSLPLVEDDGINVDTLALLTCYAGALGVKSGPLGALTPLYRFGGTNYIRQRMQEVVQVLNSNHPLREGDYRSVQLAAWYMKQLWVFVAHDIRVDDIPDMDSTQIPNLHNIMDLASVSPTRVGRGKGFFYYIDLFVPDEKWSPLNKYVRITRRNFAEGLISLGETMTIPQLFETVSQMQVAKLPGIQPGIRHDDRITLHYRSGNVGEVMHSVHLLPEMEALEYRMQEALERPHTIYDVQRMFGKIWGTLQVMQPARDMNKRISYLVAYHRLARYLGDMVPVYFLGDKDDEDFAMPLLSQNRGMLCDVNPEELRIFSDKFSDDPKNPKHRYHAKWIDAMEFRDRILENGFIKSS